MTAPLPPPLRYVTHSQQNSPAKRRHLEAYAKAAVREALEWVYVELAIQSCRCPSKVRAMIEEYK